MAKSLKAQVQEQRDQCQQKAKDLRVEIAENQERGRQLANQHQQVQEQIMLLAQQLKGEEITLERLNSLAGED